MTFSSFIRMAFLAALALLGGCPAPAGSGVSGGEGSSFAASPSPSPASDAASERPTDFLGSNTDSSDLGECDYDPTLAKCRFTAAGAASTAGVCLSGYSAVRFVYHFIAPGTIVGQTCFFMGQEDGTLYLGELAKVDSSDTVAGWRYKDACVPLHADGSAPEGYRIATGAPANVGYRGFYFEKPEDLTHFANELTFSGVEEFQSLMQKLLSQKTAIHPIVKAAEGSIAIPPKEACETPEAAPAVLRDLRIEPPANNLNTRPLSEQKIPLSLPDLQP